MPRLNWTEENLREAKIRMGQCGGVEQVGARQAHNLKVAGSTPAPATKYRSKWEPLYATKCEMEKRAGLILDYRYEPSTWYLEDPVHGRRRKRHTPDFWTIVQIRVRENMNAGLSMVQAVQAVRSYFFLESVNSPRYPTGDVKLDTAVMKADVMRQWPNRKLAD